MKNEIRKYKINLRIVNFIYKIENLRWKISQEDSKSE